MTFILCAVVLASASTGVDGVVVHRNGTIVEGSIVAVDTQGVSIQPRSGAAARIEWNECVGLATDAPIDRGGVTQGIIFFADGQRLPAIPEANASGMRWEQRWLGSIEPPTAGIRAISFDDAAPPLGAPDADVVLLRTGDRLEGFVARLADPMQLEPRVSGATTSIPLANARAITFVTQDEPRKPGSRRVWLADGSVIDAASLRSLDDGMVSLGGVMLMGDRSLSVPLSRVRAISGDAPAIPLARRPMSALDSEQGRVLRYATTAPEILRWPDRRHDASSDGSASSSSTESGATRAPASDVARVMDDSAWPFTAPAIAFDGPARLRIEISEPAILSARLVLPRDRRPWGHFQLVISSGGVERERLTLDREHMGRELRIPVVAPSVDFEIVDTGGGPVQDGFVLERAVLIPGSAPAPSPPDRTAAPASP